MALDGDGRDAHDADDAASGSAPDFDPNYDAAFQRGYTPHPGERQRTRLRKPEIDDSPFRRPADGASAAPVPRAAPAPASWEDQEGDPPTAEAVFGDLTESEPAAALDGFGTVPRTDTAVVVTGASILDRADVSPRRNPYFLALWILGGGFVVLGIVLYAISVYTSYTTSSTDLQDVTTLVFSQIGWMLAGPLVTVGLATIVALVLLTALRSRKRRSVAGDQFGGADGL